MACGRTRFVVFSRSTEDPKISLLSSVSFFICGTRTILNGQLKLSVKLIALANKAIGYFGYYYILVKPMQ